MNHASADSHAGRSRRTVDAGLVPLRKDISLDQLRWFCPEFLSELKLTILVNLDCTTDPQLTHWLLRQG